jgi:hypothetical protein
MMACCSVDFIGDKESHAKAQRRKEKKPLRDIRLFPIKSCVPLCVLRGFAVPDAKPTKKRML